MGKGVEGEDMKSGDFSHDTRMISKHYTDSIFSIA